MTQETTHLFFKNLQRVGFNMEEKTSMIANNEISIDEVLNVALSTKQSEARLCCWIISHYLEINPQAIDGKLDKAIDFLPFTTHTGQTREILRWLTIVKLNTNKLGQLIDFCFSVLPDNSLPVAIKAHAMTIIDKVAEKEPDIIPEFASVIEDIYDYLSVGGKNKIQKLLAKYKKQGLLTID